MARDWHEDERGRSRSDTAIDSVDLETVLARRTSPRKRAVRLTATLLVLLVAGTLLLRNALPSESSKAPVSGTPT
jgi:hypothetical protein